MGVASLNTDKMRLQFILFIRLARGTAVEQCSYFTAENEIL